MTARANVRPQLPLIRLNLAMPFLKAGKSAGVEVDKILKPYGLSSTDFEDHEKFIAAPAMYDVVEALSEATDDPYIGVHLGSSLDPFAWSPLVGAVQHAHSVGDLLLRFSLDAYRDASSVVFRLDTQGNRTTFTESRLYDGSRLPRHNDAFGVAYILTILQSAVGYNWDGRQVVIRVCDPDVIPPGHFDVRIARATENGFSVSFPCQWLLLNPGFAPSGRREKINTGAAAPADTLPALQIILKAHLHEQNLSSERVAQLCGMSKRTLARRLEEIGTSLKRELDALRRARAESELKRSSLTVSEIGRAIGYHDPSVFTRAFKRWSGVTPRAFREQSRVDEH